jgi:peptidoglycan/xylan/chitin deacetylase (PgdA/CDA1 family)
VDRRAFIATIAASVVAAAAASAAAAEFAPQLLRPVAGGLFAGPTDPGATSSPLSSPLSSMVPTPTPTATFAPSPMPTPMPTPQPTEVALYPWEPFAKPSLAKVRAPRGTIFGLPGAGNHVALTVDDGTSSLVVHKYIKFAKATGMRLTFFLNGSQPAWTDNARELRPLVESGQIQLGNHTWSHPDLRKLSDSAVIEQLAKNDRFIRNTYGASAKPFYRPPFGYHDKRVDALAASIGYSTAVMWYGTLSDSAPIPTQTLKKFAKTWLLPQHIVIGHANAQTVTWCFPYLDRIIHERHLIPVTLNDVYSH